MFSNHLHLSEFQFERWMKFSVFSALMALVFVLIPFVEETFELKYVLFSRTKSVGNISLFKTIWANSVIYSLQGDFFSPYTFLFKQNWNSIRIFFFSQNVSPFLRWKFHNLFKIMPNFSIGSAPCTIFKLLYYIR